MRKLNIAYLNANGKLRQESIDSLLFYCKTVDLIFITETWLPPNTPLHTNWKHHHIYGEPVPNSPRHQQGISLFIHPDLKTTNLFIDTHSSKYFLICHIDGFKIYCFYLPPFPSLDDTAAI